MQSGKRSIGGNRGVPYIHIRVIQFCQFFNSICPCKFKQGCRRKYVSAGARSVRLAYVVGRTIFCSLFVMNGLDCLRLMFCVHFGDFLNRCFVFGLVSIRIRKYAFVIT